MISLQVPNFSIEQIANSGQCFRMRKEGELWKIIASGRVLYLQQVDKLTHVFHCSFAEYEHFWVDYFDLKTDYAKIRREILISHPNDLYLKEAIEYGYGIRILGQDLWETIVSFVISQRNNIPRIRKTIEKLCLPYGYEFPTVEVLKKYTEQDFKNIGLGYRSKYLVDICNIEIDYLVGLESQKSIAYLKQFDGIGDKVANCIALFGLHKFEAFPRDVWINRIINEKYKGIFETRDFHGYVGLVQQYMFFYERSLNGVMST